MVKTYTKYVTLNCGGTARADPVQGRQDRQDGCSPKPAQKAMKPTLSQPEESSYQRYQRDYNRLMGCFLRPAVKTSKKEALPETREGSPEFYMAKHRRSLGRKKMGYY